jgi:xylose dehydrogenase (NAD/NADP)
MRGGLLGWGLLSTAAINDATVNAIGLALRSEVVAVASRDRGRADAFAARKAIPTAYDSYERLLDDPAVDVVYVPLPNSLHAEWTVRAAERGKHVLCEKPIVITPTQLDKVEAAAIANDVTVFEGLMHLHHPQNRRLADLVASGRLGEIRQMSSWFGYFLVPEAGNGGIRLQPDLGGGALWDVGIYPVSLLLATAQLGLPVEVTAMQRVGESGVDVELVGQMRFKTGAFAQFSCGFGTPYRQGAAIAGTEAMMEVPEPWIPGMRNRVEPGPDSKILLTERDGREETEVIAAANPWQAEVEAMERCIFEHADPVVPLSLSRMFLTVMLAIRKSAESGEPVAVEDSRDA